MSTSSETTPDQLLESFRGRSFKSIILFTLIAHLVVIVGSSIPYFIKSMSSKTDSKLSEQERLDLASREATSILRDIASKHGLQAQDLSAHLAGNAKPAASDEKNPAVAPEPAPASGPAKETQPATTTDPAPPAPGETPKSTIETEIEVKKPGPTVPAIPTEEADDEDLFR